ncbi:MAG TPA: hypothetical protein VM095_09125, partial [Pyrinomonadaceae bacterium]|nr:hypothetical protein [Pyrinomonadaceae bacterium]
MSNDYPERTPPDDESSSEMATADAYPFPETGQPLNLFNVEGWRDELGDILAGERDYILRHLSSVAAYTEKIISSGESERQSRKAFQEALLQIVEEWQPFKSESDYYTACLLDLIGAYLPRGGFRKLIGFMQRGLRFPVVDLWAGGYGAGTDLHLKALVNLEYYYPSADPKWSDDPAF